MNTIIVLVGVRGSGKSTQLDNCRAIHGVKRLQPSTTRQPRADDGDQYDYQNEAAWKADATPYAWTIDIKGTLYGMRLSEFNCLTPGEIGITVFHPGSLDHLNKFKSASIYEVITVGLDTIKTYAELKQRTAGDSSRDEGKAEFEPQREIVQKCDAVICGDVTKVFDALKTIIRIAKSRGILSKENIDALISAESLLTNADRNQIQSASYDLRAGESIWCKGKWVKLQYNVAVPIPPYSYVLVESQEIAKLPNFVAARYDLTVSLFIQGIVLSNGPQVDPGYEGGLSCMLFNCSDRDVGIKRSEHFATIEFFATTQVTDGYTEHHQKKSLHDFMSSSTALSPGGTIMDRFDKLKSEWVPYRNGLLITSGIFIATIVAAVLTILFSLVPWTEDLSRKADDATNKAHDAMEKLDARLAEENSLRESVQNMSQKLNQQFQPIPSPPAVPATSKLGQQPKNKTP